MTVTPDDADIHALLVAARDAAQHAYVPYSSFRVGAAVLSADGLFAAVAGGHRDLVALAVTCLDGDASQPATLMPCGACRQVMVELLPAHAPIAVDGVGVTTIDALLPEAFRLS